MYDIKGVNNRLTINVCGVRARKYIGTNQTLSEIKYNKTRVRCVYIIADPRNVERFKKKQTVGDLCTMWVKTFVQDQQEKAQNLLWLSV